MKKAFVLSFFFVISQLSFAQFALKAEDISPLLVGEDMPTGNLKNSNSENVDLSKMLMEKPSVVIFYRGGWCPYCNTHLAEVGNSEEEILKLGYQIIAISPDSPENLKVTGEKHKLKYTLLSDSDGTYTQAMGLAFTAPERSIKYIDKGSNGANKVFLPVPAIFVVDTKGQIVFEHISPNITKRISSRLLLGVLNSL